MVTFGYMADYTTPNPVSANVVAGEIEQVVGTYIWIQPVSGTTYGGGSPNKKPIADAGPDQGVYVDEAVYFDGSGSDDPDGFIMSWSWSFGDGEKDSGETASHTYSVPGVFTVTLTVKDSRSAEVSDTCIVTVTEETEPTPPTPKPAEFVVSDLSITPAEVEPGDEVTIAYWSPTSEKRRETIRSLWIYQLDLIFVRKRPPWREGNPRGWSSRYPRRPREPTR